MIRIAQEFAVVGQCPFHLLLAAARLVGRGGNVESGMRQLYERPLDSVVA
jgi:hypothetical protein